MNLLILTVITAVNFIIVLGVTMSPISFSWISFNNLCVMAVVQAIVVLLVFGGQKHSEAY